MKGLLQDWVTRQAEHRPDALAVAMNDRRLTYAQLDGASNQLARLLRGAGCQRGDRVCFLMPKAPDAIVSVLGILKADCAYVPIDTASPASRAAKIVDSCEPRWILAAGPVTKLLDELLNEGLVEDRFRQALHIGWMGAEVPEGANFRPQFTRLDLTAQSAEPLPVANSPHDPAHILFTSGSTGVPKGVIITHANVMHFVEWATRYFGIGPDDRHSGHSPLHFDLSTFDIFGTLAAGAQLHLVPPELNLLPQQLPEFIRSRELTQWFSVPSVLNYVAKFEAVQFNDFPSLRRLLWCGEVFPTPALIHWMQRLPHVTFTNLYGPTEATIASSYYTVPECPADERAQIPIGTACDGEELLVLDAGMRPTPPETVGDLYIRGVGLSPGYWRDPEKTRVAFVPDPRSADPAERMYKTGDLARVGTDGLVYFIGRADSQIKSRGYRIELGEIEVALNTLGCLEECAVVAVPTEGFEGSIICCAYVHRASLPLKPATLRRELSRLLPGYMLPSRWLALDRLPKNANGKTDRPRLRRDFEAQISDAAMAPAR